LLAALPAAPAAADLVVAFDDPEGDATGRGSYSPPTDAQFRDGDFDLRRFAVLNDGDEVVFEVTLGATFRRPEVAVRGGSTPLQLGNEVYLQNVDIYLDTDRSPGSGFATCIPGRRVAFAGGRTWEKAVVITPQPRLAAAAAAEALGPAASHVIFAEGLVLRGRTVVARVPAAALGGPARRDWGFSVQVSGARWERSFALADRILGSAEEDAFTMPVVTTPEPWAFGGAPFGKVHPRVVDVLLPEGVDQRAVLGSYDPTTGRYARVPFVYAEEPTTTLPSVRPERGEAPEPAEGDERSRRAPAPGPATDATPSRSPR
jgi:hypothetical protein